MKALNRIADALEGIHKTLERLAESECFAVAEPQVVQQSATVSVKTRKGWKSKDITFLAESMAKGMTYEEIGEKLGRTRLAVYSKAHELGLDKKK